LELQGGAEGFRPVVVSYMPRVTTYRSPGEFTQDQVDGQLHSAAASFGLNSSADCVFGMIDGIYRRAKLSGCHDLQDEHARANIAKLDRLNEMLRTLLGTETGWDSPSGRVTLFDRQMQPGQLSDGQRVLAAIATSIALQDGTSDQLILLLDEPETHLHPKALVQLLQRIDEACPKAQIWIATHSIHVIAHYGLKSLWAMENGAVTYAGSQWRRVLSGLVGDEGDVEVVRTLLGEPARAAMVQFASECLIPPSVASTPPGDPQTAQIAEQIQSLLRGSESLRVLDFGMGEGRLLGELAAAISGVSGTIDYWGWDLDTIPQERKDRCESLLRRVYGESAEQRLLLGDMQLSRGIDPGSVDCVVMCNVLHEVDPRKWISLLGSSGPICSILKESGCLLVVEDQSLPEGEESHEFGFLVLDHDELKALFALPPENRCIVSVDHPDYPRRLRLHRIPKSALFGLTADTRLDALNMLKSTAKHRAELAKRDRSARAGREFAFWAVQHFNACAAIESLRS
jgi:energy-coupling factor transporter ATP-binding protein EcfA2